MNKLIVGAAALAVAVWGTAAVAQPAQVACKNKMFGNVTIRQGSCDMGETLVKVLD